MRMTIVLSDISAALFWESQSLEGPHAPRRVMTLKDFDPPSAHSLAKVRALPMLAPYDCVHVL